MRNKQQELRVTRLENKGDGKELDDAYEFSKGRDEKETVITLTRLSRIRRVLVHMRLMTREALVVHKDQCGAKL